MTSSNALPREFELSYRNLDTFPRNHVEARLYGSEILDDYNDRLSNESELRFMQDDHKIKVPIRDISASGVVTKVNILSDDELKALLDHDRRPSNLTPSLPNGTTTSQGHDITLVRRVAKCRFVFFITASPAAPLELSMKMLMRLLTFYQVMPHFVDFLCLYGSPSNEVENPRFSSFRSKKLLKNPTPGMCIPTMDRSGRIFQLCYNLKAARSVEVEDTKTWKFEQYAVYHHFDVGSGVQQWMIGDLHGDLKNLVGRNFHEKDDHQRKFETVDQALRSSLRTHLVLARWATSRWRWVVQQFEKTIDTLTMDLVYAKKDSYELGHLDSAILGEVQEYEDKTNDTVMIMSSNISILKLLRGFYKGLGQDEDFPNRDRWACQQEVINFTLHVNEVIDEAEMLVSRATMLLKVIANRKASLMQLLQDQTAKAAHRLNTMMLEQANQSATEAVAMRIITVVTLVYLPATFSCTFFSTDIVKYQGGESFSWPALARFMQVTFPLMFLTFLIAGGWFWMESSNKSPRIQKGEEQAITSE